MSPNNAEYNQDELDAPEWLNGEFFTKVLRESEKDSDVEVKNFKITPASMKGDHYASVMFRAAVEYRKQSEDKTKSLIIKTMPETEGHKKDMLHESYIFETEIGMYTKVIPKFEQILSSIGDQTKLAAPCLYHTLSPRKLMVFEDLVPMGYIVIRDIEPTIDQVKGAFLKIAKWHAISYKIAIEDPHFFDEFKYGVMSQKSVVETEFMTGGIKRFIKCLHTVPTLHKYIPYFEDMQKDMLLKCIDSFVEYRENYQDQSHYVLCHGDFHLKNMMFKLKPGTNAYEDCILLDYQFCYMGPMVNDLIYSIYMLLDKEMRENHLDELLYYYFSNFLEILTEIGFEGPFPKLNDFRQSIYQHKHFEIFLLTTFLPMWYAFRSGKADVEAMMSSPEYSQSLYESDQYIQELHKILPKYLHLGYFDN